MNSFIFNGVNSNFYKSIIINELPSIIRPAEKFDRYDIQLYNGQMINDTGYYDTCIKQVECTLKDLSELDKILKWLRGSGHVIFSNQPDRYYMATIVNKISFDRVAATFRSFIIEFECQPFGYLTNGTVPITLTGTTKLSNPGTVPSEPKINIYGTGEISVTIGNETFTVYDVDEYITVDTPLLEVYKESKLLNRNFNGEFPTIGIDDQVVSWIGAATKIEIVPNWRCL